LTHLVVIEQSNLVILTIDAPLSSPPSSVSCFRDVTLMAKMHEYEDVLLVAPKGMRTFYWRWLKNHGAYDYLTYIVRPYEAVEIQSVSLVEHEALTWSEVEFVPSGMRLKAIQAHTVPMLYDYLRIVRN
jgi:hypothetical protein